MKKTVSTMMSSGCRTVAPCRFGSDRWSASFRSAPPPWWSRINANISPPFRACVSSHESDASSLGDPSDRTGAPRRRRPGILALVNPHRLVHILSRMLDENEFLSPYGLRSLSRFHEEHPYIFMSTAGPTGSIIDRLNRTPGCSAATPIGAARSGFRSTR